MERKTYTSMLVRPKDDKRAKHHWSPSMHFERGKRKRERSPFSLFAMKWRWIEIIYHYACDAKRRETRNIPLIYLHAFRIKKKKKGYIYLFLICYETALDRKHIPLCLWGQKTTNAQYTIDLPPCISNKEKGKRKCFLFPYRYETALDKHFYHSACNVRPNRQQTRYIPLIYLHAFRIRKKEKGNISFFLIRYETALDRKTYTNMLVRLKDDKRAIFHCSTSMYFE